MCTIKLIFFVFWRIVLYFCHNSPKTKITSLSFENPLGIRADGTISIPKEVILAFPDKTTEIAILFQHLIIALSQHARRGLFLAP